MKKYDFVFVYEVKNRELENICLIAQELEKRGYSVEFVETWHAKFWQKRTINAKVTIGHAMYDTNVFNYIKSFVKNCQKFVNMQWEQIFRNVDIDYVANEKETSIGIYDKALDACHISWGKINYNRLRYKYGVPEKNVRITGHTTLDFLRPEFDSYYKTREELYRCFNIPADKKTLLFISSFAYSGLPNKLVQSDLYQNQGCNVNEFIDLSVKSQQKVLDWFEKILLERKDLVIIYRPHPAENDNRRLKEMIKNYNNFLVIGELSVKQWIKCVDKVYLWYSTAIAEVYMSKKTCSILRPIEIPYELEVELYNNGRFVSSYDMFVESLDINVEFPIPIKNFEEFYAVDEEKASYIKVCDYLEEIYLNSDYDMNIQYESEISNMRRLLHNFFMLLLKNHVLQKIFKVILRSHMRDFDEEEFKYNLKMSKNNYASRKEIFLIKNRIKKCLEKSKRTIT